MLTGDSRIKLIVAADEPALFFTSVDAAERYLEIIDVQDGIYTAAYGPEGQCYQLGTRDNRVIITADFNRPGDAAALKMLLVRYLTAANIPASEADSLNVLIKRCERYISA